MKKNKRARSIIRSNSGYGKTGTPGSWTQGTTVEEIKFLVTETGDFIITESGENIIL